MVAEELAIRCHYLPAHLSNVNKALPALPQQAFLKGTCFPTAHRLAVASAHTHQERAQQETQE